jgi:hypothetical protein
MASLELGNFHFRCAIARQKEIVPALPYRNRGYPGCRVFAP